MIITQESWKVQVEVVCVCVVNDVLTVLVVVWAVEKEVGNVESGVCGAVWTARGWLIFYDKIMCYLCVSQPQSG